jgi:hypothetical protein
MAVLRQDERSLYVILTCLARHGLARVYLCKTFFRDTNAGDLWDSHSQEKSGTGVINQYKTKERMREDQNRHSEYSCSRLAGRIIDID